MFCIYCRFGPLIPLTLWMDHAKFLAILTSLPVSHAILPCAVYFETSRLAIHATCTVNVLKFRTRKIIIFSAVRNFKKYVSEKVLEFVILECGL